MVTKDVANFFNREEVYPTFEEVEARAKVKLNNPSFKLSMKTYSDLRTIFGAEVEQRK